MSKVNLITSNNSNSNIILNKPVYNFLDIDQKQNVSFNLKTGKNRQCSFNYLLIINNKCNRNVDIICDIKNENIDIKINFNILIYQAANIFVKVKVKSSTNIKSNVDIHIEGIIDQEATLSVCPIFDFNHNLVNAAHSVKIGNINLNELHYLTSRGIDNVKAKTILTKSKTNIIFEGCSEDIKSKYLQLINNLLGQNYGN